MIWTILILTIALIVMASFDIINLLHFFLTDFSTKDVEIMFAIQTSYLILTTSMILVVSNAYNKSVKAEM